MARKTFDNLVTDDGRFKKSGGGLPAGFDPHKNATDLDPTPGGTVKKHEDQSIRDEDEQDATRRGVTPRTAPKIAAVMTHPDVQQAIKKHVNSLKGKNLKTSLGVETLACVERQYDRLRTAWTESEPPDGSETQGDPVLGAGMFGLSTQATETKVAWQLWGVSRQQISILDKAYNACGAPSRSAFVEKAIRLDLMEREARPPRKTRAKADKDFDDSLPG
jgi:hypothetical protein